MVRLPLLPPSRREARGGDPELASLCPSVFDFFLRGGFRVEGALGCLGFRGKGALKGSLKGAPVNPKSLSPGTLKPSRVRFRV